MPSVPTASPASATTAGIVTDEGSGQRHIPESKRPDGTTRKAIKIRPGYRPPEDVEVYKNRTAEAFRSRGKAMGIPGAAGLKDDDAPPEASSSNTKNAKRREARRKAKATADDGASDKPEKKTQDGQTETTSGTKAEEVDPEAERQKEARKLTKKLRQAKELQSKRDGGESLLPEQIAKVIKISELIRELDALGFDGEGEPKDKGEEAGKEAKA